MSGSIVDPHDKMRARDISKVTRGEQAPRPVQEHGNVSRAPPPSSTDPNPKANKEEDRGPADSADDAPPRFSNRLRNCCIRYYEYYRCLKENEKDQPKCEKFAKEYQALCPYELIAKWDEERKKGDFPGPL
ncbi:hypothetical protein M9H77_33022 [Catharanthus roseus]|uniref:Uncharacterized protein n=1 Tax=Catharanthus roseus TaxID=4058 RepID=A0ACC0A6F9_CATRO|nr:hypothetical protein M9H77_33022 [Catharanthus roseus]